MLVICLQPERAPPTLRDFSVYSMAGSAAGSSSALACATAESPKMKNWVRRVPILDISPAWPKEPA